MSRKFEIRLFRKEGLLQSAAVALFLGVVFFTAFTQIADTDIWWRLAEGRYMLQERSLVSRDVFSYTAEGLPWKSSDWLFGLLAYLPTAVCGLKGLVFSKAVLITLTFGLLYSLVRRHCGNGYIALGLALWAMLACRCCREVWPVEIISRRWELGPDLFSFLLLIILLTWLYSFFRNSSRAGTILAAPIIILIWSTLNQRASVGLIVLGVYIAGELIKRVWRSFDRKVSWPVLELKELLTLIALFFICAAIAWYAGSLSKTGLFAGKAVSPLEFPAYGIMLLAAAVILFLNVTDMDPTESAMLLVWGALSLTTVKNVPIFALCAAPIIARQVSDAAAYIPGSLIDLLKRTRKWWDAAICAALAAALVWAATRPDFGISPSMKIFPLGAATFIEKNRPEGEMFNPEWWGGYLIWKLFPAYRVFIDGRGPDVYPADVRRDYEVIVSGSEGWEKVCDSYRVNFLLIPVDGRFQQLIEKLWENPQWRIVYWDLQSLLYARNLPAHMKLIDTYNYKNFDPESQQLRAWVEIVRVQGLSEVKRYLKDSPDAIMPRSFLAMHYFQSGRFEKAAREYKAILEIDPKLATIHHNLALIASALGDEKKAEEEYLKEIDSNPSFPPALNNLGRIYLQRRLPGRAEELFRKSLEIDPKYVHARSNLASIYMERGEFEKAAVEFEAILNLNPHDRTAFHNLKIARQLSLRKKTQPIPAGRVYGPLTKEEAERFHAPMSVER